MSGESFESCLEILNIVNVTGSHSYTGILRFEDGEEVRLSYLGHRNFFDRTEDSYVIGAIAQGAAGLREVEFGRVSVRQGDVRRFGRFLQDGTVILPYAAGVNFRWTAKRRAKDAFSHGKPTELVFLTEGANRQVSYKEFI